MEISKAAAAAIIIAAIIPAAMLWTLLAWGSWIDGEEVGR